MLAEPIDQYGPTAPVTVLAVHEPPVEERELLQGYRDASQEVREILLDLARQATRKKDFERRSESNDSQELDCARASAANATNYHIWLTLVVLPVVLILYIQAVFLPYHDISITWGHRLALVCDIAMPVLIGVFLMRVETSFFQALVHTTLSHPWSFGVTALVLAAVALFSFFAATVPGEALDRISRGTLGITPQDGAAGSRRQAGGFVWPFAAASADGRLFGLFTRNLIVTDTDLVADKDVTPGEPTLKLRGRDLRYARLDRSDLHQADLTGADISQASFIAADLRGVWLQCADLNELLLSDDRERAQCAGARRFQRSTMIRPALPR